MDDDAAELTMGYHHETTMRVAEDADITLTLNDPAELYEGPRPGHATNWSDTTPTWDHIGAVLGEPGVTRLLRLLHAQPRAKRLVVRLPVSDNAPLDTTAMAELEAGLRRWCRCRIESNRNEERLARRFGLQSLVYCTGLLGIALGLSWMLQSEAIFGPAGPVRVLIAEAVIIAGWVVMWRPIEQLVFDPRRPAIERRLLERVAAMQVEVRPFPSRAGLDHNARETLASASTPRDSSSPS